MSPKGRRKNSSVVSKLVEEPYSTTFLQAVRLLERSARLEKKGSVSDANYPVGKFFPPTRESIRFSSHQSLAFPSSEIKSIHRDGKDTDGSQWKMSVNLMGLTGPMGVLPFHYTELILDRQKQKDESMAHFFDLFNHRSISLFHEASIKYRLALQYERHHLFPQKNRPNDSQTQALLSLIGLGTEGLSDRLLIRDESLLYYSGIFSQKVRTESGLRQILQSHFRIPIEINQFVGQWQDLIDDVRTKLPDFKNPSGRNACLGRSAMLGKKGWFAQGKIYIILGPLDKQQLSQFAPGTSALKALDELVRMYVGLECDFEFKIRIKRQDIPKKIQLKKTAPPVLAWNVWLSYGKLAQVGKDEIVDISISASRLR